MIVYLKNEEIDRDQWDSCVTASRHFKPYALSWYLDIISPGWEALVDDDYDAVFPIPGFRKLGFNFISTPLFLQQLGVYSPDTPESSKIHEFIDYMPRFYRVVDLNISQKINYHGYKVTEMQNLELDLLPPYEILKSKYSHHCQKHIEIATKRKFEITPDVNPDNLVSLFRKNTDKNQVRIKEADYQRLKRLMQYCIHNRKGRIIGIKSRLNDLLFGVFIVETHRNITILFTAGSSENSDPSLGYLIIDEIIKEFSGRRRKLDCACSTNPAILTCMESVGGLQVPYYHIYRNCLPWPVSLFK